ncbi:hypothetical protein FHG66_11400 [Rubellimicrobium rubrum]|uniref:Uncharacterized protein n=1 Tax=Rubellimicrobium rubrum TaxID=2585369 RepID=A0A5C4MYX7_9RHOB|nr:hypothetical protein [Rubellimicrobium rubrum]TNC49330.1 hypothetical protein FHG66_11400 [Rubellimicrobium rubrum]
MDEATLCPETGPVSVTAILLDLTDPLGPAQAARLRTVLAQDVASAPLATMISIGVVSDDPSDWGAHFATCKPAEGSDANPLTENASLIQERFESQFERPLGEAIDAMMAAEEQDQSPIMEALQVLLAETPHALEDGQPLRVVLVSDLLQHSDLLSFYRGEGWEAFEASGGAARLSHTLNGAEIRLVRVPRPNASAEAQALVDPFWAQYLDQQGAKAPFDIVPLGDL